VANEPDQGGADQGAEAPTPPVTDEAPVPELGVELADDVAPPADEPEAEAAPPPPPPPAEEPLPEIPVVDPNPVEPEPEPAADPAAELVEESAPMFDAYGDAVVDEGLDDEGSGDPGDADLGA
jgi:hypothetical protein